MPEENMVEERPKPLSAEERDELEVERAAEMAKEEQEARIRKMVEERPIMGGQGPDEEEPAPLWPEGERPFFVRGYGMKQVENMERAKTLEDMRFHFRRLLGGLEGLGGRFSYIIVDQTRGVLDEKKWELEDISPKSVEQEAFFEEVKRLREEFDARNDLNTALDVFEGVDDDLPSIAALFLKYKDYTLLDSKYVWGTLFKAPLTKEGEPAFGDKIDKGMRWFTALAMSFDEERFEQELNNRPWLRNMISQEDREWIRQWQLGLKNLFVADPPEDKLEEMRDFVLEKLGGDEAAEQLAWRIFRLWGIATTFARGEVDGKEKLGGFPVADDRRKIFWPKLRRELEAGAGHLHGPDKTVKDTSSRLAVDFLHYLRTPYEPEDDVSCQNIRSFWELWWNEEKKLGELPWGKMPKYAWYDYCLRIFFAGRKSEGGISGLFEALTREKWDASLMANPVTWREMNKAFNIVVAPYLITEGEYSRFPDRTWGDLNKMADAEKLRISELLVKGAAAASKQDFSKEKLKKRWGGEEANEAKAAQVASGAPFGEVE